MKRIVFLAAMFFMVPGTGVVFAQADADNFYRSNSINVQKVSFDNQYKMKVAGNLCTPKNMKKGEKYPAKCIIPGAGHVELYDRVSLIPLDKLEAFFKENLQ